VIAFLNRIGLFSFAVTSDINLFIFLFREGNTKELAFFQVIYLFR